MTYCNTSCNKAAQYFWKRAGSLSHCLSRHRLTCENVHVACLVPVIIQFPYSLLICHEQVADGTCAVDIRGHDQPVATQACWHDLEVTLQPTFIKMTHMCSWYSDSKASSNSPDLGMPSGANSDRTQNHVHKIHGCQDCQLPCARPGKLQS